MQNAVWTFYALTKIVWVLGQCDPFGLALNFLVERKGKFHLGHHAQPAIATHHGEKEIPILRAIELKHTTGRIDQLNSNDTVHQRTFSDIAAVTVERNRTAHAEIAVALHDCYRESERIGERLQIAPAHARLHTRSLARGIQPHQPIHHSHVQMQRLKRRNLSAHAVARPTNAHRAAACAQCLNHRVRRARPQYLPNLCAIELAYIIDILARLAARLACKWRSKRRPQEVTALQAGNLAAEIMDVVLEKWPLLVITASIDSNSALG